MNILIGDPHITIKNLKESEKFFDHIIEKCIPEKDMSIDVHILGDGQHNHSVIRMEVLNLWDKIFKRLS